MEKKDTEKGKVWGTINDMLIQNKCWLCLNPFERGKTRKVFMMQDVINHFEKRMEFKAALAKYEAMKLENPENVDESEVKTGNNTTTSATKDTEYSDSVEQSIMEGLVVRRTINDSNSDMNEDSMDVVKENVDEQTMNDKPKSVFSMDFVSNVETKSSNNNDNPEGTGEKGEIIHAQKLFDEKDVKDFIHLQKCWERYCDFGGATPDLINEMKENDVEMWMSGLACCRNAVCKAAYECIIPSPPDSDVGAGGSTTKKKNSYMSGKFYDKNCPPGCGCDNPWPFMLNM